MTFKARCGCPISKWPGSPNCSVGGGAVTWCSVMASGRTLPDQDGPERMMWAAVEVGDLVRTDGGLWWEVTYHDVTPFGEVVGVRGTGDVVHWAKTTPTPAEHVAGWSTLDPRARVWVIPCRDPARGTTAPITPEQAAWRIARLLGGVEIPT